MGGRSSTRLVVSKPSEPFHRSVSLCIGEEMFSAGVETPGEFRPRDSRARVGIKLDRARTRRLSDPSIHRRTSDSRTDELLPRIDDIEAYRRESEALACCLLSPDRCSCSSCQLQEAAQLRISSMRRRSMAGHEPRKDLRSVLRSPPRDEVRHQRRSSLAEVKHPDIESFCIVPQLGRSRSLSTPPPPPSPHPYRLAALHHPPPPLPPFPSPGFDHRRPSFTLLQLPSPTIFYPPPPSSALLCPPPPIPYVHPPSSTLLHLSSTLLRRPPTSSPLTPW